MAQHLAVHHALYLMNQSLRNTLDAEGETRPQLVRKAGKILRAARDSLDRGS